MNKLLIIAILFLSTSCMAQMEKLFEGSRTYESKTDFGEISFVMRSDNVYEYHSFLRNTSGTFEWHPCEDDDNYYELWFFDTMNESPIEDFSPNSPAPYISFVNSEDSNLTINQQQMLRALEQYSLRRIDDNNQYMALVDLNGNATAFETVTFRDSMGNAISFINKCIPYYRVAIPKGTNRIAIAGQNLVNSGIGYMAWSYKEPANNVVFFILPDTYKRFLLSKDLQSLLYWPCNVKRKDYDKYIVFNLVN